MRRGDLCGRGGRRAGQLEDPRAVHGEGPGPPKRLLNQSPQLG